MEKPAVHAIVAKMIISEELMASMDEPSECMIMDRTEPSRLQSLSLQLADKLAQLVENNERLEVSVMMEIVEMETKILVVVTEMSNLVIDKGAIVREATNLMTRKDSMTESQVILFHQEIGSSCLKNFSAQFRSYIHQRHL